MRGAIVGNEVFSGFPVKKGWDRVEPDATREAGNDDTLDDDEQ